MPCSKALRDRDLLVMLGVHPELLEGVESQQVPHDARIFRQAERIGRLQKVAQGVEEEVPELGRVLGIGIDIRVGAQARQKF